LKADKVSALFYIYTKITLKMKASESRRIGVQECPLFSGFFCFLERSSHVGTL